MPFVTVRDIQMYYDIHGTGPRLLFISGTGGDLRRKPGIFDSPLAKNFKILAYDQRGLGQSERPNIPYTMADYAMDTNSLLDAVGWNSCSDTRLDAAWQAANPQQFKELVGQMVADLMKSYFS
jgi:3-oxoadipate enol-lactonase